MNYILINNKEFTPITRKINFIIIISLIIGIGIIIAGSFYIFFTTTNSQIVENLTQQSEILYKTIVKYYVTYLKQRQTITPQNLAEKTRINGVTVHSFFKIFIEIPNKMRYIPLYTGFKKE